MSNISDTFYIGAYWGDRREDLDVCAERLTNFLLQLCECDEIFQEWFGTGWSRREALANKLPIEVTALRKLLDKQGRHRGDIGKSIIEELGFHVCLWNGRSSAEGAVGLSVTCGLYAGIPGLVNSCVIHLPDESSVMERIIHSEKLVEVLNVVVRAWHPDWAIVTPHSIFDVVEEAPPRVPEPAWILFLSERRGNVPTLPPPSRTVLLEGLGTIIVVTEERFDTSRKDHIKAVKKVCRILKKAGLLAPIPQLAECPGKS